MKIFCTSVCVIFLFSQVISEYTKEEKLEDDLSDLINATINDLLKTFPDPLDIKDSRNSFNNIVLTGDVDVFDLNLIGVRSIVASRINISLDILTSAWIDFEIEIGNINLFTGYDVKLILGQLIPFFGTGNFSVNIDSFDLQIYAIPQIEVAVPPKLKIKDFYIQFSIGKNTSVSINGILNSDSLSNLINNFLEVLIQRLIDFLDVNSDRIAKTISSVIQSILDITINGDSVQIH